MLIVIGLLRVPYYTCMTLIRLKTMSLTCYDFHVVTIVFSFTVFHSFSWLLFIISILRIPITVDIHYDRNTVQFDIMYPMHFLSIYLVRYTRHCTGYKFSLC